MYRNRYPLPGISYPIPPMFPPKEIIPDFGNIIKPITNPINDVIGGISDTIDKGINNSLDKTDNIIYRVSNSFSEAINRIIKSIFNINTIPTFLGLTIGAIILLIIIAYIIFKVLKYL